jgi:protein phosphatase
MAIEAAARTHAGRVRTTNEDAWVSRPAAGLFAVVDGMGGEACGEVAAAIAVQALAEVPDLPGLAGETILAQAFTAARERILAAADEDPEKEGMGAVATAVRFDDGGGELSVAHVGDSRAYLVGVAGVRVLTHDHLAEGRPGTKRQVARDLGRRDLRGEWVETSRVRVAAGCTMSCRPTSWAASW